jgi:hypothetical protein
MNIKLSDLGTFAVIFAVMFVALSIIGSPVLSFLFVFIYRMLENGLIIFLPFIVMRKKPAKQQVFMAIGLIILLEFIWRVNFTFSAIIFENIIVALIFSLILEIIGVAILLIGTCFIQNMKFVKPDKPLVISMIVYIVISLARMILSVIYVITSVSSFVAKEVGILRIMGIFTGQTGSIYSQLSNMFSSTIVRAIIGSVFVFFLVRFMRKSKII